MTHLAHRATRRTLLASIVSLIALALAAPALGGGFLDNSTPEKPNKPTWAVPAKRKPIEGTGEGAMTAELHNAEARVREALQNVETANWAYRRARTRRYPRGEALQEIKNRVVEMETEQKAAISDFNALVEKARQSGVPAGTLAPYMDFADEVRRSQAAAASGQ